MDALTRRKFLIASGVLAGGALAGGLTGFTLRELFGTAGEGPDGPVLVLVTLYGGNDGLATVIPYADPAYHDARADLAYKPEQVLVVDESTGLNPALTGLERLYGDGRLLIVRGVGYPEPDRSHFRSMDIWQTAQPQRPGTTGWLGRWLDSRGGDPRRAVSFEPVLPPLLAGATCAGAAIDPTGATPFTPAGLPLDRLAHPAPGEPALQARAAGCFADLIRVDEMIIDVRELDDDDAAGDDEPAATATGGVAAPLAAQLDLVGDCIEAGVMTRVFSTSLGGFDLHADEMVAQERLLASLDSAVSGFVDRMSRTPRGQDVAVLVYSEFGRRVRANASDGTDHGTASNLFLLGPRITGGRLIGKQPSLTDLDRGGDLKATMDFRDVYAAILADVLDADPERILDGWTGRLPGSLLAQPQ
jgi:uncharacterized protein (DUF1501 family)